MLAEQQISWVNQWVRLVAEEWRGEVPLAMHRMGERGIGPDGTPDWSSAFDFWLTRGIGRQETDQRADDFEERSIRDNRGPYQNTPQRLRFTRALRKLRRHAPLEYIVAYKLCVTDPPKVGVRGRPDTESFSAAITRTVTWLNQRAEEKGTGETYDAEQITLVAYAAMSKISHWS